jgi:hypothetical protein
LITALLLLFPNATSPAMATLQNSRRSCHYSFISFITMPELIDYLSPVPVLQLTYRLTKMPAASRNSFHA